MSGSGVAENRRNRRDSMPRWVKVFALSLAALLLVVIAVMLLSGSQHGPGRHASARGLVARLPGAAAAASGGPETADTAGLVGLR